MSIPYELSAEYANGRINNYKLMHVDDKERIDRRKSLSQGEKCIIALVMFILKCKKSKSELFVIDDPASAFDDYRKSQIFQLVESRLSGKTVLLFSHDPVFAKYAVISKKKGRIVYFRKGINGTEFTDIDRDDFGIFEDFIKDKILNCTDYYRVLVNLRLLYEGGRGPVYKYLSAIIHRTPKTDIDRLLDEEGITEAAVFLKMIEKHSWLRGKLRGFMDSINPINPSQWSLMEKAFLIREAYEKEVEEAGLKNELNEFVHINKKLRVCLDPYRFNLCSKELEGFLENIDLDNYYSGSNALIQPMRE